MIGETVGRGWNIKCFDKIKLTHISTTYRIHSNTFAYKSGSYNTAVSCHKMRDESDWYAIPEKGSLWSGRKTHRCRITFGMGTRFSFQVYRLRRDYILPKILRVRFLRIWRYHCAMPMRGIVLKMFGQWRGLNPHKTIIGVWER